MMFISSEQKQILKQNIQRELLDNILNIPHIPVDIKNVDILSKDFSIDVTEHDSYYKTSITENMEFEVNFLNTIEFGHYPITKRVRVTFHIEDNLPYNKNLTVYTFYFKYDKDLNITSWKMSLTKNGEIDSSILCKELGKTEEGMNFEYIYCTNPNKANEYDVLRCRYVLWYAEYDPQEDPKHGRALFGVSKCSMNDAIVIITSASYELHGIKIVSIKQYIKHNVSAARKLFSLDTMLKYTKGMVKPTSLKSHSIESKINNGSVLFTAEFPTLDVFRETHKTTFNDDGTNILELTKDLISGKTMTEQYISDESELLERRVYMSGKLEEKFTYAPLSDDYYIFPVLRSNRTIYENHKNKTKQIINSNITQGLSNPTKTTKSGNYGSYLILPEKNGNEYYITLSGVLSISLRINGTKLK